MFRSLVLAGGLLLIACSGPGTSSPPDAPPTAPIDAAVDAPDACVSSPERCDGADSDCDGVADDPWQDVLGEACSVGVGACAAQGTVRCTADGAGAACDAVAGQPAATDMCGNDLDDDCDGAADEGCVCDPGETRPCGVDLGACELGTQTCSEAGAWGDCAGGVEPAAAELCNGADDDCDGPVDEGVTAACDTGIPGACRAGVATCVAGSFGECVALATPAAEVCNAIDDDCDGDTDEALTRGCGSDVGECQAGTATCRAGDWSACEGQIAPATETCDGRDEDCDGTPDDGCPAAARLLAPPNGHHTGSARAAATAAVRKPLRPRRRDHLSGAARRLLHAVRLPVVRPPLARVERRGQHHQRDTTDQPAGRPDRAGRSHVLLARPRLQRRAVRPVVGGALRARRPPARRRRR